MIVSTKQEDAKTDKTILVVDDEPDIRRVLQVVLEHKGYSVLEAENGLLALETIEKERPDLVVMDIQMPLLTGFEACQRMRSELGDTSTYVIALTAKSEVESKVKGLNLGIDAYFTKPYNLEELLAQIRVGLQTTVMRRNSLTDSLTGLPNRSSFHEHLSREIARSKRYENKLSLAFIDLDNFKPINDIEGHQVGDDVLRSSVHFIQNRIRESDFFARIGGDEFVIFLPNTPVDGAKATFEPICDAIKTHSFPVIGKGRVSFSVGLTELKSDDNVDSLIKRSDDAVYQAKDYGGGQVVVN